jgi:hypothetical protein
VKERASIQCGMTHTGKTRMTHTPHKKAVSPTFDKQHSKMETCTEENNWNEREEHSVVVVWDGALCADLFVCATVTP